MMKAPKLFLNSIEYKLLWKARLTLITVYAKEYCMRTTSPSEDETKDIVQALYERKSRESEEVMDSPWRRAKTRADKSSWTSAYGRRQIDQLMIYR
jgi:hypothetical protein